MDFCLLPLECDWGGQIIYICCLDQEDNSLIIIDCQLSIFLEEIPVMENALKDITFSQYNLLFVTEIISDTCTAQDMDMWETDNVLFPF